MVDRQVGGERRGERLSPNQQPVKADSGLKIPDSSPHVFHSHPMRPRGYVGTFSTVQYGTAYSRMI